MSRRNKHTLVDHLNSATNRYNEAVGEVAFDMRGLVLCASNNVFVLGCRRESFSKGGKVNTEYLPSLFFKLREGLSFQMV